MANIPIRDIPGAVVASPDPSNIIPMDNGSLMQKTTIANAVNTTLPLSSQVEAQAGVDNIKRMSPLRTKQAIDAQVPGIVNSAITSLNLGTMSQEESSDYTPTSGLAAVALSNDYNDLDNLPPLGTMSQETASDYTKTSGLAAVALSNDYNDLDSLPTLGSAAATDASDYATAAQGSLADSAVQPGDAALVPPGGTIGQVLVKNSGTNYDTGWVSSAAATAVSYAPQTLTPSQKAQASANIGSPLRGHLYGLTLANNATDATNDIDITAGEAASDGATPYLMKLTSTLTKRLDAAWSAGSGNGGLDTGSKANNTGYHVWLIMRSDNGAVDALFSTSPTSPTMPAGYDLKRRIGWVVVDGSGSIRPFIQAGDRFIYRGLPPMDISTTAQGTAKTLYSLSVPKGVRVLATVRGRVTNTASTLVLLSMGDADESGPPAIAASPSANFYNQPNTSEFKEFSVLTDAEGRVALRAANASTTCQLVTVRWVDTRGRT